MLSIRKANGLALYLDRKVAERDGYGVWSFHQSQCSWALNQGRKTYRHARIKPADPGVGKTVEIAIVDGPDAPVETWVGQSEGVVVLL